MAWTNNEASAAVKEPNRIDIRLVISGFDCSPDEITRSLELTPTEIRVAGQPWHIPPGTSRLYKESSWIMASPASGGPEMEEQVDGLISVVAPHADRFRRLPNNVYIELSCSVYGHQYVPAIHFTAVQVQFLASLGAEIDVDVYDLTGDEQC